MLHLLKLKFLVFLLLLLLHDGLNSAPVDPPDDAFKCGISQYEPDETNTFIKADLTMKIIDGIPDKNANWLPWMAAILTQEEGVEHFHFHCSSTIIGRRHILTAAHCFTKWYKTRGYGQEDWPTKETGDFFVSIGTVDWQDKNAVRVKSAQIILPPNVKIPHDERKVRNDIAVIELSEPLTFSNNVRPICLKVKDDKFIYNKTAVIAGWGRTKEVPSEIDGNLHIGHMLISDSQICLEKSFLHSINI